MHATDGAACVDFCAVESATVPSWSAATVRTGLAVELEPGTVLLIFSRSGHGFKHGLRLVNGVGVIDADYRGEILVRFYNDSAHAYHVQRGERIAQGLVLHYPAQHWMQVGALSATDRGTGGFGSTGHV